jgi:hypothetical protein
MKTSTKRYLGLSLICISVVAAIVCLIIVPHRTFAESAGTGDAIFWGGTWEMSWQSAAPIFICGLVGLGFLAASMLKPPKLPSEIKS